ncbi:MAG: thrombospondin type-1 domain-containing protein, partial [Bdellovibrionales bacterium]|nr:thrombospondin type-1 domain-containing protein [Bdellovibrionales bacterium]
MWGSFKTLVYFITGGLLLLAYNNCAQSFESIEQEQAALVSKAGVFWPNATTTLTDSVSIKTGVVRADLNNDGGSESVFVSDADDYVSPVQDVIRIIDSNSYAEIKNILGMRDAPTHKMNVLLLDVDLNGSGREILYVDRKGRKLIAIDVFSNQPHEYLWEIDLIEKVIFSNQVEMYVQAMNGQTSIVVGNNKITLRQGQNPTIDYFNERIDGGWTNFSPWSSCSRLCGGGERIRMRACSSPYPQNGGLSCSGDAIDVESCNTHVCDTNCPEGQRFQIARCVLDTPSGSGSFSSVGAVGGGVSGGGTGGTNGGSGSNGGTGNGGTVIRCNTGSQAYNPATDSCVSKERSCTIENLGGGTQIWNGTGYGRCQNIRCY